jgi:hypothetical protein
MTVIYDKVAVIGMGLIGASIALAARRGGLATTIIGSDQSPEVAAVVARLQLVDSFEVDAAHAVADADLVILAVPVGAVGKIAEQVVPPDQPKDRLSAMLARIYAMILLGCHRIRLLEPNIQGQVLDLNRFLMNAIGLSFRLTLVKPISCVLSPLSPVLVQ